MKLEKAVPLRRSPLKGVLIYIYLSSSCSDTEQKMNRISCTKVALSAS